MKNITDTHTLIHIESVAVVACCLSAGQYQSSNDLRTVTEDLTHFIVRNKL